MQSDILKVTLSDYFEQFPTHSFMFMKTYHIRRVGVIFFMPAWLNSILNIFPKVYHPLFQFKVQYTPTFKVSFLKMQFVCKRRLMIKFYAQCIFLKISCKFGKLVFSNAL